MHTSSQPTDQCKPEKIKKNKLIFELRGQLDLHFANQNANGTKLARLTCFTIPNFYCSKRSFERFL